MTLTTQVDDDGVLISSIIIILFYLFIPSTPFGAWVFTFGTTDATELYAICNHLSAAGRLK
jgi:hypothetical protein